MGVRTWAAACAAAAAMACAGAASATVYTLTFDGSFTSGTDVGGDFGTKGASLAGDAYTFTTSYDDSVGSHNAPGATAGGYDGLAEPTLSSVFTVNGVTLPIDASFSSYYLRYLPQVSGGEAVVQTGGANGGVQIGGDGPITGLSGDMVWTSTGQFFGYDGGTIDLIDGLYGRLTVSDITVTPVSDPNLFTQGTLAIPEPATWMMLLLGAGLLGAELRRRRQSPVAELQVC